MRNKGIDVAKLREAIKGQGIDPRYWASYGTVCVLDDEGTPDFDDPQAVHVAADGTCCDVYLEPLRMGVTCRYAGMAGGSGVQVIAPIRAGDRVLVVLPEGSPIGIPVVVAVMHSEYAQVPLDGSQPLWKNDRVLVYAQGVAIDVHAGEARVVVNPDGQVVAEAGDVRLGSDSASQQVIKGNTYTTGEKLFLEVLKTYAGAIQGVADPSGLATAALNVGIDAFKEVIDQSLSDTTKTE